MMKHFFAAALLLLCHGLLFGQYASKVIEYAPAPGQLINTDAAGSLDAAETVVGGISGLVSLGAYGGSLVLGFSSPIKNDSDNPYGVDFIVFGNALTNWAEPGIVQVMKDENQNGVADDTWYELAGSDYFFSSTLKNYQLIYTYPNDGTNQDIPWYDNYGNSGSLAGNSYHSQPYYPTASYFPNMNKDSLVFTGTCIQAIINQSDAGSILSYPRQFGYADNCPKQSSDFTSPDNPYTSNIEGCGGDPMDISWAIDASGNYVNLDEIDFVRIYTAANQSAGWLGEISTEIAGVVDVAPNTSLIGETKAVTLKDIDEKVLVGDTISLEAFAFESGRLATSATITYKVSDTETAFIDGQNGLIFQKAGSVVLTATWSEYPNISCSATINGISPTLIEIEAEIEAIPVDSQIDISASVLDQDGNEIDDVEITWSISDESVLKLVQDGSDFSILGLSEGSTWLKAQMASNPEISDSLQITVYSTGESKMVYITLKDSSETYYTRAETEVRISGLTTFVDRANNEYLYSNYSYATVAHAIAAFFQQEGLSAEFAFRDDARGNSSLYLWKVPLGDETNRSYLYGYGGATTPFEYAKGWMVLLNNHHYCNNLDQIALKNGDEIIIYHVSNTTGSWTVNQLTASQYTANTSDTIDLFATQITCSVSGFEISVESANPLAYETVLVDGCTFAGLDGNLLQTDDQGMASCRFSSSGEKYIQVKNDKTVVDVKPSSGKSSLQKGRSITVYPQPATSCFTIKSNGEKIISAYIFDLSGRITSSFSKIGQQQTVISTENLKTGCYLLKVTTASGVESQKVIVE